MEILNSRSFQCILISLVMFAIIAIHSNLLIGQEQSPRVNVKLQVFSGLPNPEWFFDDPADLAQLRGFVRGLPETGEVAEPQFGAFLLLTDQAKCRFPERVLVFNGIIKATTAVGTTRFFQDVKGFENFLRTEATERGLGEFLPPPQFTCNFYTNLDFFYFKGIS